MLLVEDPVIELRRQVRKRPVRPERNDAVLALVAKAFGRIVLILVRVRGFAVVAGFLLLAANLRLTLAGTLLIVGILVVRALGLVAAFPFLALVRIRVCLRLALDQLEIAKPIAYQRVERGLVGVRQPESVEICACLLLNPDGHHGDARLLLVRWCLPGR